MEQQIQGAVIAENKGLQLSLIPDKSIHNKGEMPVFRAVLKNVSAAPLTVCLYMARHRLLSNMLADGYEVLPFEPTPTLPLRNSDFKTLKPGEEMDFVLDLSKEKSYGFVYTGSLPPIVPADMAILGFPAGVFTFQVHLGSHVSYFNAPEGTYNFKKNRVHILSEVPGENLEVKLTQVWDGELVAKVPVIFR